MGLCQGYAQQKSIERIYLATDRRAYISGETVWLSLYCFDASGAKPCFSELSSVAYIELRDGETLVSAAKLKLEKGRGGGKLAVPISLPTGNYRLIAYTRYMLNEDIPRFFDMVIPIFNTLTTERISGNVLIKKELDQEEEPILPLSVTSKEVAVQWNGDKVRVQNLRGEAMTLNISIARVDIPEERFFTITDFWNEQKAALGSVGFKNQYILEYEGEIIRGRVENGSAILQGKHLIYLSTVGTDPDVYAAPVDAATGDFSFFTKSIVGSREIALELPEAAEASFALTDPFVKPVVAPAPPLLIDPQYEPHLLQRSIEMQVNHHFGIDTLFDRIAIQEGPPLSEKQPTVYLLDDYTRFSTMQDIVLEFVSGVRFRKINNRSLLQVVIDSDFERGYTDQNALVLIDGVAVFDHERLIGYDLQKVKSVSVYHSSYRIGGQIYDGLVCLNTYKGNFPGLFLGKNAVILDYEGVQYPCRFTGGTSADFTKRPDLRSLLYWDPLVELAQGENREFEIRTSSIPGKYAVIIEGVTAGGQLVYSRTERLIL